MEVNLEGLGGKSVRKTKERVEGKAETKGR